MSVLWTSSAELPNGHRDSGPAQVIVGGEPSSMVNLPGFPSATGSLEGWRAGSIVEHLPN